MAWSACLATNRIPVFDYANFRAAPNCRFVRDKRNAVWSEWPVRCTSSSLGIFIKLMQHHPTPPVCRGKSCAKRKRRAGEMKRIVRPRNA
eukprot:417697-Prymnesium_polylepis.1